MLSDSKAVVSVRLGRGLVRCLKHLKGLKLRSMWLAEVVWNRCDKYSQMGAVSIERVLPASQQHNADFAIFSRFALRTSLPVRQRATLDKTARTCALVGQTIVFIDRDRCLSIA